ncbi:MAG: hypothetical protein WBD20_16730 [Pirellulaceae bacterium]
MNLIAFEIPESQSDIPTWLESVMCEGELRGLVAQLAALPAHEDDDDISEATDLESVIDENRDDILSDGLSVLPIEAITALLRYPTQLLRLQELTMAEGGDYWHTRYQSDAGIADQLQAVRQQTDDAIRHSDPEVQSDRLGDKAGSLAKNESLYWLMALAAGILLAAGSWMYSSSTKTNQPTQVAQKVDGDNGESVDGIGWGWASENGVPTDISGSDYLTALAQGAASWGKKQPADKPGLRKRLTEFRAGCNRLANMKHTALSNSDAKWLRESCTEWLAGLDRLIASVDKLDFETVKSQADALAQQMESSLTQRASV